MKHAAHRLLTVLYTLFVLAVLFMMLYFLMLRPEADEPTAKWVFVVLASGGMLMMVIYNIALYLFRQREKAALYFALFCLGAAIRFFFMEGNLGPMIFPDLSPFTVILLRYLPFGVQVISVTSFVFEVFGQDKYKKLKHILNAVIAADILVILTFGVYFTWIQSVLALLVGIPFITICIVIIAKSPEFKKSPLSVLYLIAYILYLFSFTKTVTANTSPPYIAVVFNYLFAIAHVILLSARYAQAITAVEKTNELLEVKVQERTAELAASEKNIRDLVRNISHDLKTPMSVLCVNLEMLLDEQTAVNSDDFKRYANIAYHKSLDLQRLTRNLFEAVRMETGKTVYNMEWLSLSALLNQAHEKYAGYVEESGISLSVSYIQDCLIWIDDEKIWSVFDNIINNSMRYTKPGGTIRITASTEDNENVSITISDTGCGIAAEHLSRIFDRYYMADNSRSSGDSGLGLYIVKTTVEGMGGTVSARSEVGIGMEIIFSLKSKI